MHFYTESFQAVQQMPLKTFWFLSNSIDRIQAQKDLRQMSLNLRTGNNATPESVKEISKVLIDETGVIAKISPLSPHLHKRDQSAFDELKGLA